MGTPEDPIRRVVSDFLEHLQFESRRRMKPASAWVTEIELALRRGRGEVLSVAEKRDFARQFMEDAAFETLFDHTNPTGDEYVRRFASQLAEQILKTRCGQLAKRCGSSIAEPRAAPGVGSLGLIELGRQIDKGAKIENKGAYLRTIIVRYVDDQINKEKGHRDHVAQQGLTLIEQDLSLLAAAPDELAQALRNVQFAELRKIVHGPPITFSNGHRVRFTPTNRSTFDAWEAAGFDDIAWEQVYEIDSHKGAVRLDELKKKLKEVLGDW